MILKIKKALSEAAKDLGRFETLSISEIEEFAQGYNFTTPLIRLEPIENYTGSVSDGGVIINNLTARVWFLTKFNKDDTNEDRKDVLIDEMEEISNEFYRNLNKSQSLSQGSLRSWTVKIVRQATSNLLCGVICEAKLDTNCVRL